MTMNERIAIALVGPFSVSVSACPSPSPSLVQQAYLPLFLFLFSKIGHIACQSVSGWFCISHYDSPIRFFLRLLLLLLFTPLCRRWSSCLRDFLPFIQFELPFCTELSWSIHSILNFHRSVDCWNTNMQIGFLRVNIADLCDVLPASLSFCHSPFLSDCLFTIQSIRSAITKHSTLTQNTRKCDWYELIMRYQWAKRQSNHALTWI